MNIQSMFNQSDELINHKQVDINTFWRGWNQKFMFLYIYETVDNYGLPLTFLIHYAII